MVKGDTVLKLRGFFHKILYIWMNDHVYMFNICTDMENGVTVKICPLVNMIHLTVCINILD